MADQTMGTTGSLLSRPGFPTRHWPGPAPTSVTWKWARMVASICSVTSPARSRGSMISRRAAAPLRSLTRGGSAIWMASRKVSHSPHRVARSLGSTRASRAENLVLLEPAVAQPRGRGQSLSCPSIALIGPWLVDPARRHRNAFSLPGS